jgi:hypothetical protein
MIWRLIIALVSPGGMRSMNRVRLAAVAAGLCGIVPLAMTSSATAETAARIDAGAGSARDQCAAQIPDRLGGLGHSQALQYRLAPFTQ